MQQIKVGGPFLDEGVNDTSTCSRRPIITPLLLRSRPNTSTDLQRNAQSEMQSSAQYLLIPEKDRIQVISMEHGGTIMDLIPQGNRRRQIDSTNTNDSLENIHILSADVVKGSQGDEWLIIAGCSNCTLLEWSLNEIHEFSANQVGTYSLSSIQTPRRMFHLRVSSTGQPELTGQEIQNELHGDITHISSLSSQPWHMYALIRHSSMKAYETAAHFVSISLPPWSVNAKDVDDVEIHDPLHSTICPTFLASFVKETKRERQKSKTELRNALAVDANNDDTLGHAKDINTPTKYSFSKYSDKIISLPFLPILLLSGMANLQPFALIVQPRGFTIFCDNKQLHASADRFVHFPRPEKINSKISTAAISPDCEDVALASTDGKIDIYTSFVSRTTRFVEFRADFLRNVSSMDFTMKHPGAETLIQQYHWHALSVPALCYLGSGPATTLLSGGEESVLVTWNMERGVTKPSHTLPRLSKGAISHIVTSKFSSSVDIVVRCMDNTLQLIHAHNYLVKWRIQGLTTALNEPVHVSAPKNSDPILSTSHPILVIDPRTKIPILSRLAGAPGVLQWFDFMTGRVVGELEISPYNRVSRKEANQLAHPRPVITHLVISANGDDIVTVDSMLTENPNVGASRTVAHGTSRSDMSLSTNIKFWAWSKSLDGTSGRGISMPYEMIAAMHAPHGLHSHVDALALSPLGNKACTFSFHEGSFHIWDKGRTSVYDDGKQSLKSSTTPPSPPWRRLYKISTPAGFANAEPSQEIRGSNLAFSADGSLLAVAYGKNITLWDHSSATMLHSIVACDTLSDIQFIKSPVDMLLAVGRSFVSTLPLFGMLYLGGGIWSYTINSVDKKSAETVIIELGPVTPLLSSREIAIVLQEKGLSKTSKVISGGVSSSKVVLIDCHSGDIKTIDQDRRVFWDVPGSVICLCDVSSRYPGNTSLLAIKDTGEMILLNTKSAHDTYCDVPTQKLRSMSQGPRLTIAGESESAPMIPMLKKPRLIDTLAASQIDALDSSRLRLSSESPFSLSTSELPILSSSFTTNILGRILKS